MGVQLDSGAAAGHGSLESMSLEPLMTRDYERDPAIVYERLRRAHGPVAPVDLLGVPVWLVLGYEEAFQVLRDDHAWPKGLENWRARRGGRVPLGVARAAAPGVHPVLIP